MDPVRNPYTPNAGARPRELAGRDELIDAFRTLLARVRQSNPGQSMIMTGLRGVGKTVLLNEFERFAQADGWATVPAEVGREDAFAPRVAQLARRALLTIAPSSRWKERARRAAQVLKSFSVTVDPTGSVTLGLDVDALEGRADSGQLADDLTDLLVALGEAAKEHETGVIFLIDEIQNLAQGDFEALIRALHRTVQLQLPILLVGAGLPQVPRLAGEAGSYAERLFRFPNIERLPEDAARDALLLPAKNVPDMNVTFAPDAVTHVLEYTEGYPYFLQEYGKFVWDYAAGPEITLLDAQEAQSLVEAHLDESFFRVRSERSSVSELRYMRAMAALGAGPQTAAAVAQALGQTSRQVATIRSRLVAKGLLYTPSYGTAAFTVPQFDKYLRRAMPPV